MSEDADKKLTNLSIFFLGNSTVGKTSFISKYMNDIFKDYYLSTIGIDFIYKIIKLPTGEEVRLLFYDTAGQEQYRAVSYNLLKGADGLFLMYDIGIQKTFDDINEWLRNIREIKGDNFPIILLGNKCDLEEEEKVITKEEGEKLANDNGLPFFETSCKEGINIEESVQVLVSKIIENKKLKENKEEQNGNYKIRKNENFKLLKLQKKEKNKKKCCS